jgi:DNA-binding beta-propeller fold protein YncE
MQIVTTVRANLGIILFAVLLSACASQSGSLPVHSAQAGSPLSKALLPHWSRASIGTFADPYGVAVDQRCQVNCDVYVADPGSNTIWKITPDGTKSAVGNFPSNFDPQGVAVVAGIVYVADRGRNGAPTKLWGILRDGRTEIVHSGSFSSEYYRAIAADPRGEGFAIYGGAVSPTPAINDGYIRCFHACALFGNNGATVSFHAPYGVAVDGNGYVYAADAEAKLILRRTTRGGGFTNFTQGHTFVDPYGVAVSLDGKALFVADAGAKDVWERANGETWTDVGTFADPYGVAVDAAGTVYVADPGSKTVWKLTR